MERDGILDALAGALVLADLSDSRQVAGFAEQVRRVAEWAAENDDVAVAALASEALALLGRSGTAGAAGASASAAAWAHDDGVAGLLGELIEAARSVRPAGDEGDCLPAAGNAYAQDPALLADFVASAREQLDEAEGLISEESTGGTALDIDALFRCFHTVKGIAGFLALDRLVEVAHEIESPLSEVRAHAREFDDELAEEALRAIDVARALVDEVGAGAGGLQAVAAAPTAPSAPTPAPAPRRKVAETVRVDAGRLEGLLDAMGELAVAEAAVRAAVRAIGDDTALAALERLERIGKEMQATATSLRMVSLQPTFRKMSRVVHDMVAKSDRTVDMVVSGADTELDRSIVDAIGDPLVHLLRNAVDHGIEPRAERLAAGKPETGRVELRAFHKGGSVYIEVADDGRGIHADRLVAKAENLGLDFDRSAPLDLIFVPGFSTAASVTEVSGRGVGMDAVLTQVTGLRGHLEVASEPGVGTTFSIRLPLTLAVIDGIVFRAGRELYIAPTHLVERTLAVHADEVVSAAGRGSVIVLPDGPLAIFPVTDALGGDLDEGAVAVVLHDGDERFAMLVDEVVGKHNVVIKPLSGPATTARGVSGAALMGDGSVALLVDPSGVLRTVRRRW